MVEHAPDTRRRLLEAAGEVFAQRGFRGATVREICRRAGANIAAVNYHFRDKATLYSAALRHAHERSLERHPTQAAAPDAPAAERLLAFVRSFLHRALDEGETAWHGRLMVREMAEPTPTTALDDLVRDHIQGHFRLLEEIIRDLGPEADAERVRRCAMSVVGQCLFFRLARPVLDRLFPGRYGAAEIESLAQHICDFTLAAAAAGPRGGGR